MGIYNKKAYYRGIAAAQQEGKWGFVDRNDQIVIPFEYDELYPYHDHEVWFFKNRINIRKDGKWGYIDAKGNVKIPFIYDYAHCFSDFGKGHGYARVVAEGEEIVIDMQGKKVFHNRRGYNNPDAMICVTGALFFEVSCGTHPHEHWGVVDQNEKIVVPVVYTRDQFETIKGCWNLAEEIFIKMTGK